MNTLSAAAANADAITFVASISKMTIHCGALEEYAASVLSIEVASLCVCVPESEQAEMKESRRATKRCPETEYYYFLC